MILPAVAGQESHTLTHGQPVGLLAGAGRFPIYFAEKAEEAGIPVVCIGVKGMADPALERICTRFHWLRRLSLGYAFRCFRRGQVQQWTMAGKFHKQTLMTPWIWFRLLPDLRMARFWLSRLRRDNKDDSLLLGLIHEFHKEGMDCVSALDLCPELLVKEGILTQRKPNEAEKRDLEMGWAMAKEMGRLDIGQSVMIRNRVVMAVEAIEGTDLAIRRAGDLCGGSGFVVVKVSKPQQDMRFDVPTIGVTTIETMHQAGATALGIEASKTILLDESSTLALANRYGIAIVASHQ